MDSSKVILVQPPIEDFYLTRKRTIPYGLACIASAIRQKGFEVEILDGLATGKSKPIPYPEEFTHLAPFYGQKDISAFSLFHEFKHFGYSFEHLAVQIRNRKPFLVGISALFTAYFDAALKTARAIKKFFPDCRIVMGGHHPTIFPKEVLSHDAVDFIIRGEGETGMAALCEALYNGLDLKQVPGIAFRSDKGLFISKPHWEKDLSRMPLPALDLISHKFYRRSQKGSAVVVSSRGCPMQCTYCSVSASSSHGRFRQRRVSHVLEEIKALADQNPMGFIDFEDENLCLNKPWFMELFSGIRTLLQGKNIELRAMNGLFPPAIDEEIVLMMKSCGFKTLNLSLGSTSPQQLKRFRRPDVRKAFETALELARKHHLECVSYIIAAGPGQSARAVLDDLLYLAGKRTLVGLSIFYPAPGSQDYETCRQEDLLPDNYSLMRSTALPLSRPTTRMQSATLLRLSRILNFAKHLIDTRGTLPGPRPFSPEPVMKMADRDTMSTLLFQWFLHDGKIRGMTPDGTIFSHETDKTLAIEFSRAIQQLEIAGVK